MPSSVGERLKETVERARGSRVGRAADRYLIARGNLLSGGVAYSALFSIAAALTISWTAFMAVLGGNEQLREQVLSGVDDVLPGLLQQEAGNEDTGMINPDSLILDSAFNLASVVAIAVLLWTALSVMAALKMSIRAMFGIVAPPENVVVSKGRDLIGFVVLAVGIVLAAVLATVASTLTSEVLEAVDLDGPGTRWLLRVVGLLAALAVDWGVFIMLFRFTAGVRPLRRDLLLGSFIGAVAAGVLRYAGTSLIGAVDDPILASFAALVTLLLWVNLAARVALFVAAFTANPPAPERPETPEAVHLHERPNYVTESDPRTREWDFQPLTGAVIPHNGEEDEEADDEPEPYRGGLVGAWQRRRIAKAEERLAKARARYVKGATRR